MPILNTVISWFMKKRIHQIELFLKYPIEVQLEWLKKLMVKGANTEWGKMFEYKTIDTPEKYRDRIPVQTYDSLKPYIDRLRNGEHNILWPTKILWFAVSSGTTNDRSKFIPVSNEALEECHFKGGKDLLSLYCNNNPATQIFDGKTLGLGGSHNYNIEKASPYYGDVSAVIMQNLPFWFEVIRTPDLPTALMVEWEEKLAKIAEITKNENVTVISGVPSWMLLLLIRLLEITGKQNISEVWPNLEMYTHGGVNFTPYRNRFENLCPDNINYIETYNASEGFFGIQDSNNADDMLLMLDYGIFYEFIPLKNLNDDNPKTLWLDEVELNTQYAMVISTNSGLWRYQIGDVIFFTSLKPYRIKIKGRTKSYINAFGEELMVDNAEKAIALACEKTNSSVTEFTAAPIYQNNNSAGSHQWIIEFDKQPSDIELFIKTLDLNLKKLNSDYEAKRHKNLIIDKPQIIAVPKGTFYNWMKKRGKLGGQNKVPRLSNNREYVDEITDMLAKH